MQVVTPTFITESRETRSTGTDWQHSQAGRTQVIAVRSARPSRTGGCASVIRVWSQRHRHQEPDIFLPRLATVAQSLSIVLREVKPWTELGFVTMVHSYISSYIYIYLYLFENQNKQTKRLQVFRVWDLTGIHDPAQNYLLNNFVLLQNEGKET